MGCVVNPPNEQYTDVYSSPDAAQTGRHSRPSGCRRNAAQAVAAEAIGCWLTLAMCRSAWSAPASTRPRYSAMRFTQRSGLSTQVSGPRRLWPPDGCSLGPTRRRHGRSRSPVEGPLGSATTRESCGHEAGRGPAGQRSQRGYRSVDRPRNRDSRAVMPPPRGPGSGTAICSPRSPIPGPRSPELTPRGRARAGARPGRRRRSWSAAAAARRRSASTPCGSCRGRRSPR